MTPYGTTRTPISSRRFPTTQPHRNVDLLVLSADKQRASLHHPTHAIPDAYTQGTRAHTSCFLPPSTISPPARSSPWASKTHARSRHPGSSEQASRGNVQAWSVWDSTSGPTCTSTTVRLSPSSLLCSIDDDHSSSQGLVHCAV